MACAWKSWATSSIWAWDHILLGVEPNFPIHEALIILTAIAARTTRIKIGTGILVMPVRNPVLLAKELATIDHVSNGRLLLGAAVGWYKREFDSLGTDFTQRGKIMEQSLEIIKRLWTEEKVDGSYPPYNLRGAVLYPKPVQKPHPPILIGGYVDAVLKRAATKGDGWLTYYYTAESFKKSWAKIRAFAEEAGRNPDELTSTNQLPICIGPRAKIEGADEALAADRMGLRFLVGVDHGQRDHGHAGRVRGAAHAAYRSRHRPHHLRPVQIREGAGGGGCPRNHPAAQKEGDRRENLNCRTRLRLESTCQAAAANLGSIVMVFLTLEQIRRGEPRFPKAAGAIYACVSSKGDPS